MLKSLTSTKSFRTDAYKFIPISCYFNEDTILTKNGELIQSIEIPGLYAQNINPEIINLRDIVRETISKNIDDEDFSCWIHTIREKRKLDEDTDYQNIFCENLNRLWQEKNKWNDKYTNKLFLTIVIKGLAIELKEISDLTESFYSNKLRSYHEKYLSLAFKKLNKAVNLILNDLEKFQARRLYLVKDNNELIGESLAIFNKIINIDNNPIYINKQDLSKIIGNIEYAVGNNLIELKKNNEKKYISVFSIKEIQNLNQEACDFFLQSDLNIICTEIFFLAEKKEVEKDVNSLLKIYTDTSNSEIPEKRGLRQILNTIDKYKFPFCKRQISITIFGDSIDELEYNCFQISQKLSRMGLLHVREDVNLENALWAQFPGNFSFLRRLENTSFNHIAPLASIQNFSPGLKQSIWGRYLTLFETEKNTLYYYDFFDNNIKALNLFIGEENSGKTIIMNFLLSQAFKYKPVYLSVGSDKSSYVFSKSLNGSFFDIFPPLDPFSVEFICNDPELVLEILKIIFSVNDNSEYPNMDSKNFENEEIDILYKIRDFLLNKKNFKLLDIAKYDFSNPTEIEMKKRASQFIEQGGKYQKNFKYQKPWKFDSEVPITFSFEKYTDMVFIKNNYPSDKQKLTKFKNDLFNNSKFRELILISLISKFIEDTSSNKSIINIDNFNIITSKIENSLIYRKIFEEIHKRNNVCQLSVKFNYNDEFFKSDKWELLNKISSSKFYMPYDVINPKSDILLKLDKNEFKKLISMKKASRIFILKKNNLFFGLKIGIGIFTPLVKILSSDDEQKELCDKFIKINGTDPENWLVDYYNSLLEED